MARQPPAKTSLTEIARRYHAAAVALAQTLGLSVPEVLAQHRESVTAIFIESGRCELRLPAGVTLPPLTPRPPEADAPVAQGNGQAVATTLNGSEPSPAVANVASVATGVADQSPEARLPTTVPTGLPCAGQPIADLKPPQLRMLLSRADQLAAQEGSRWRPLLEALTAERQARLQAGQRQKPAAVAVDVP